MKVDAKVPVPEILDLSVYRGLGVQSGEILIPEGETSRRERMNWSCERYLNSGAISFYLFYYYLIFMKFSYEYLSII